VRPFFACVIGLLCCTAVVAAEPATRSAGRIRPPATLTCDINHVTSWSGVVSGYLPLPKTTWLQISTDDDTIEETTIDHDGKPDASAHYLLWGEPFTATDWPKIEKSKGMLIKGIRAVAWICDDGKTAPVIDWQPPQD
jgi:hypothetical protein